MTYREMWERHVEPNLERQREYAKSESGPGPRIDDSDEPLTIDQKVAEAQAAAMLFGQDPIDVGKAVRASWPLKPGDIKRLQERVAARNAK